MAEPGNGPATDPRERRRRQAEIIARKEARKIKAGREKDRTVWFGLGMFGLVGWSISIPTLIGVAVGVWIDLRVESRYAWTLILLFIGVVIGCANAWFWINREGLRGEEEE